MSFGLGQHGDSGKRDHVGPINEIRGQFIEFVIVVVVRQSRRDRVVVVGELDGEVLERIMTAESGANHPKVVGVRDERCRRRMDTNKARPRLDTLQEGGNLGCRRFKGGGRVHDYIKAGKHARGEHSEVIGNEPN